MASTHDLVRHLGYKKTYDHLANQFIWPNMTKDIQEYVKTCDSCQHNKESTQLPARLLHQPDIPVMPGTTSPWTSSVYYHLHNGTEFDITLFSYTKTISMDGLKY